MEYNAAILTPSPPLSTPNSPSGASYTDDTTNNRACEAVSPIFHSRKNPPKVMTLTANAEFHAENEAPDTDGMFISVYAYTIVLVLHYLWHS